MKLLRNPRAVHAMSCIQRNQRRQHGAAMMEFIVVATGMLPLTLGIIQTVLIFNAKTTLNYATFEAARVGAVNNGQRNPMYKELAFRMAPLYGGGKDSASLYKSTFNAALDIKAPVIPGTKVGSGTKLEILNPTFEAFEDFGVTYKGQRQIPNAHLRYRARQVGDKSGVTIQDANLLKIRVTYGYKMIVPLINKLVAKTMLFADSKNRMYYLADPPRIPLVATATVRMQSNAIQDENISDPGPATPPPGGGGGTTFP